MYEKPIMSDEMEELRRLCIRTMQDLFLHVKVKIKEANIVERRKVKLSSGGNSELYANVKKLYGMPEYFGWVTFGMTELLAPTTTCVAASGYGGIPLAAAIAARNDLKLTLVRQGERTHGLDETIVGHTPTYKDHVAIIDDVCTTGANLIRLTDVVETTGAKIVGCYVVVNRNLSSIPKYRVEEIIKLDELLRQ